MSFRHVAYMLNYRSTATADTVISCLQNVHFIVFVLYPKWMEKINNITAIEINDFFLFLYFVMLSILIYYIYTNKIKPKKWQKSLKIATKCNISNFIHKLWVCAFIPQNIFETLKYERFSDILRARKNTENTKFIRIKYIIYLWKAFCTAFLWFVKNKSLMGINLEYVLVNWVKFLAIG